MNGKGLGSLIHNLTTSLSTPPASPNQTFSGIGSFANGSGGLKNSRNSSSSSLDSFNVQQQQSHFQFETKNYGSYQIKYIGSTPLGKRHTLPMLNWLVTDLLCQSRCDGEELHVAIRGCVQKNTSFERLREQLNDKKADHGLDVTLNMCKRSPKDIELKILNRADEQMLLCHSLRQIFLFGRHSRERNVFFYVHKENFHNDHDRSRPMLFVFQARNDSQLSEICHKYTDLRPLLCFTAEEDKHMLLNVERSSGLGSNCFEVLHVGTTIVSQKRASPSMVDSTVEEFRRKFGKDDKSSAKKYKTKRFLVEVIEENENELDCPSKNSLISNTQSLDYETRNSLLREFNQKRGMLSRTPSSENVKSQEITFANKTMLLLIGQLDICLISVESHKTVLSKTFSNISHCSQGVAHSDHFAIIVREPFAASQGSTDSYVAHIFQCQTDSIVNELLIVLRQAFSNAYKASKMRQSLPISSNDVIINEGASSSEPYCDNCPMNWFHQLCLDTDGLDNDTIFVLLMFRIEQYSSDEKKQEFHTILEAIDLKNVSSKVDVLMILLKARAERLQKRHEATGCKLGTFTIYDQISAGENVKSKEPELVSAQSSLTRLGGLRLMAAKSSITNTLESLFKSNKNLGSTDSLQQNPTSPMQPPSPKSPEMFQRRNTVADCSEIINEEPEQGATRTTNHHRKAEKCHSLNRNEQKSLLNMFMKVTGSNTKLNSLEEFSANFQKLEKQESLQSDTVPAIEMNKPKCQRSGSIKSQMRHRLYKRICKSIQEYEETNRGNYNIPELPAHESLDCNFNQISNNTEYLEESLNELKHSRIKQNSESMIPLEERVNYETIKTNEKDEQELNCLWDKLMDSFRNEHYSGEDLVTFTKQVAKAVAHGIPKIRKNEIWQFLASIRKGDWNSNECKYHDLLGELTTQQHAIFVDLGRTFPNIQFFANSMGEGQLALFNLLKAYSILDTEVGYCQGLSFVAGILLLHLNEDTAFDMMCFVLFDCGARDQYKPDMAALQMQMYQMSRLLCDRNPLLHDHLERYDVQPTLYAAPCFLTLFASQFPISFVSRVFDFLILHGFEAIFCVLFCMLDRISGDILSCSGFEPIVECIREQFSALTYDDFVAIFARVGSMDGSVQRQLDQYKVEYAILQEEFAHLSHTTKAEESDEAPPAAPIKLMSSSKIDPVDHESENKSLRAENLKLKRENDSLRKMIQQLKIRLGETPDQNRAVSGTDALSSARSSESSDSCFLQPNDSASDPLAQQ